MKYAACLYGIILFAELWHCSVQFLHTWTFTLLSAEAHSNNELLMKPFIHVERVKRNFVLTGSFDWHYDCNDTYVQMFTYRSATGNDDYKLLPFTLRKQHFKDYMNSFYKTIFYPNVMNCSNFPKVAHYQPPWEHKLYYWDKCLPSTDGMPTHMQPGYYKIEILYTGEVDWNITINVKI